MKRDSSGFWKESAGVMDITTTSSVRAWWLSKVCGYRVRSIAQLPRMGRFGRLRYCRRYHLAPRVKP